MLDNIKMLLGIADTSKDALINYYIDFYTKMILKYCHIDTLNGDLESIIEQIIVAKFGGVGSKGIVSKQANSNVKSMTRGDWSETYFSENEKSSTSKVLDEYAIKYQGQLNLWRRLDY